jgi:predicted anti-sigma-YlaC factor YlaD
MGNLDAILVEGDLDLATGRLLHRHVIELPYMERIVGTDRCVVAEDHRHVVRHTRRRRRLTRNRRRR